MNELGSDEHDIMIIDVFLNNLLLCSKAHCASCNTRICRLLFELSIMHDTTVWDGKNYCGSFRLMRQVTTKIRIQLNLVLSLQILEIWLKLFTFS